jgi:phosphoglycolate phosphatase
MTRKPLFIMFDLDGTLVDTASEIAAALNCTLEEAGLPAQDTAQVRDWIGKGTAWLFGTALVHATGEETSRSGALFQQHYPRFLENYHRLNGVMSAPYPQTLDALIALSSAGYRLGVVTNKGRPLTLGLLERHGLDRVFDVVVAGGDTPNGKPSPEPLELALRQAGVRHSDALFVGDSSNDVQAARHAKVPVWTFDHGYNHGEPIASAHPDLVIQDYSDLAQRLGVSVAQPTT